jgi:hypothetical protein
MVVYHPHETARLGKAMPPKDLTVTQDDTFPGGLCLITMAPESTFSLAAQLAQARDHARGHEHMGPALAQRHCRVIPSTSDAASGLLAYGEHALEAPHSPDLCHGQHELVKAVSGPRATKERAAYKAATEAREQLEHSQTGPHSAGDEPAMPKPSRPPKDAMSLAQAEQALAAASRAHEHLAPQRQQIKAHIRGIGHDDPWVDLERGVRRNGPRIAADLQGHREPMRTSAQQEGRSQRG